MRPKTKERNVNFHHFDALGGYARGRRAIAVLDGLDLGAIEPERPLDQLSGGQKTRLGLATLLLDEPDLLLLDEPTNHLDQAALEWLEDFVVSYPRAVLIVSHDRAFLDRTVSRILYLEPETRTVQEYSGNYSDFAAEREREAERHQEAWTRQQEYVSQVRRDIGRLKQQARNVEAESTPKNEPLNHLDIESREHFAAALDAFSGTVIVVTHDRAFQQSFGTRFVNVQSGTLVEA